MKRKPETNASKAKPAPKSSKKKAATKSAKPAKPSKLSSIALLAGTGLILTALNVVPASAAEMVNLDKQERTVSVKENGATRSITLKPGEKVTDLCPAGCELNLPGDPEGPYEISGTEMVGIEEGSLYDNSPLPDTAQGDGGQPLDAPSTSAPDTPAQ